MSRRLLQIAPSVGTVAPLMANTSFLTPLIPVPVPSPSMASVGTAGAAPLVPEVRRTM